MAGSSDCIMSFNRWQKLIAIRTPKTVSDVVARNSGATPAVIEGGLETSTALNLGLALHRHRNMSDTSADLSAQFIERSRHVLGTESPTKLGAAVKALPADALWWRANTTSNSVGNLLLH